MIKHKQLTKTLIFSTLMIFLANAHGIKLNLKMTNDTFVTANMYEAYGDEALLWLPSEYGNQISYVTIAEKARKLGLEVWIVDLFKANYMPPSIRSLEQINPWQISEVINQVLKHSPKRIWLMSSERGAQLVLRGLNHWQKTNPKNKLLGGALLLNPDLTYGTPPVGQDPDYLPISYAVNKPIFILQSRLSENYWYFDEIVKQLQIGGALVKYKIIEDVRNRFHFRRYTEDAEDRTRYKILPPLIHYAIKSLTPFSGKLPAVEKIPPLKPLPNTDIPLNLNPLRNPQKFQPIALPDIQNKLWKSDSLKNKVLLVSFWAEWCVSCRVQLKRQQKLYEKINSPNFEILSIHFDGIADNVKKLIRRYKIKFPILMGNVDVVKQHNIRKFPSSLIIDKHGKIRYALYGLPNWSKPEIITIINQLQAEK